MVILFDIGGTKIRVANVSRPDSFDTPTVFATPKTFDEGIELLKKKISELSGGESIEYIIGGIAGMYSEEKRALLDGRNLSDWVGKPISKILSESFGAEVIIDNDAALVGLGEAVFGAGKGFDIVAYITVSTGVGGARIVGKELDERSLGFEPGKQIIDLHGDTLENLISGGAVEEKTGKKPEEIKDPVFWDGLAKTLSYGLNNIVVNWSPSVVVVGGSMMNEVGISIELAEKYLHEVLGKYPNIPPLKKAELGDFGGLYGGLAMLQNIKRKQND